MNKQLIVGFATEGSTDERFLKSIIERTFWETAYECDEPIEVFPVLFLEKKTGDFIDVIVEYSKEADQKGIMVLCVHCDADAPSDKMIMENKIVPSFSAVESMDSKSTCTNLVAVIPVMMTEAWMLCDKALLKEEIGTTKSDLELGLEKFPENYNDPKQCIEDAIRVARKDLTKRRRGNMTISELYLPIGNKLSIQALETLPSYRKFKENVRLSLMKLNYMR